jgi:hypothetical protein
VLVTAEPEATAAHALAAIWMVGEQRSVRIGAASASPRPLVVGTGIGLGHLGFGGFGEGPGSIADGPLPSGGSSAPRVRMGAVTVNGRLPPEVIQRIVRQRMGRIRLCYDRGLTTNPKLEGRVAVRYVIGRDGSTTSVASGGSDMPDPAVVSCVLEAFRGLTYPQPEAGIVTVVYPIVFSPPR